MAIMEIIPTAETIILSILFFLHHFHYFVNHFAGVALFDFCRYTRFHVVFEYQLIDLFERCLYGKGLMNDVNAVVAVFDHRDDAVKLTPCDFEAVQDFFLDGLVSRDTFWHSTLSIPPWGI